MWMVGRKVWHDGRKEGMVGWQGRNGYIVDREGERQLDRRKKGMNNGWVLGFKAREVEEGVVGQQFRAKDGKDDWLVVWGKKEIRVWLKRAGMV